ncbi:MAG TPA: molybdenum cofactor guanylyltransferase [Candidatus Babeliales bacterium]|nr:molybdenum cofactor guanylyltransferase [Candidatus Babeliales bacterium]
MADAVVLLAGGEARRFPRKLDHPIEGLAMLARVYERVRELGCPVYVAGKGSFGRELDARLDAPLLVDRRPGGGPLRALLDAGAQIRADRIFAVAADQPQLESRILRHLAEAWRRGDEAVVPEHDGEIEPLAALYGRVALLRAGFGLRRNPFAGVRDCIESMAARFVSCDARYFRNVNRVEDLA